jgi:chorismate dehydratase
MKGVRVSVVSYLNSKPFAYGIENSAIYNDLNVSYDHPAHCAQKLISGNADIGLVPVAVIPEIPNAEIISEYCIAADGKVDSVLLLSNVPVEDIKRVILDEQSRTSVMLARVLAAELWNIQPEWIKETNGFQTDKNTAAVVIGDRALEIKNQFRYIYDLAAEWKKLTGLPFVFACWVANKHFNAEFISAFNAALRSGVENIDPLKDVYALDPDAMNYLKEVIVYRLDDGKRKAIELFLGKIKDIKTAVK